MTGRFFTCHTSLIAGVFFMLTLILGPLASAQSLSFSLKESLPIESVGFNQLAGVSDLDGDGALEGLLCQLNSTSVRVVERQATGWVTTQDIAIPATRTVAFGDVDLDGTDEFLTGDLTTVTIREATGNNTFGITGSFTPGNFVEQGTKFGDSDGDGLLEFLVPRETSPATVHILEATGDDTYTNAGTATGTQLNCVVAGVADVDGDTLPELIFHDSPSASGAHSTYVYEGGSLVATIPNFAAFALGDTDDNGLVEIIGRTQPGTVNDLRVFERNGDNSYTEVWSNAVTLRATDLDRDGITDLHAVTLGGGGDRNVITIYERGAGSAVEVWNSDLLFQGSTDSITSIIAIGDTDSNGEPEVAVLQGQTLHILERDPAPPASLPALGVWGALGLGLALVASGILRQRPRLES